MARKADWWSGKVAPGRSTQLKAGALRHQSLRPPCRARAGPQSAIPLIGTPRTSRLPACPPASPPQRCRPARRPLPAAVDAPAGAMNAPDRQEKFVVPEGIKK